MIAHLKLASHVKGLVQLRYEECTHKACVLALRHKCHSDELKQLAYSLTDPWTVMAGQSSTCGILHQYARMGAHLVSSCAEETQEHREVDSLHIRLEIEPA